MYSANHISCKFDRFGFIQSSSNKIVQISQSNYLSHFEYSKQTPDCQASTFSKKRRNIF